MKQTRYSCELCDFTTYRKHNLEQHSKNVHPGSQPPAAVAPPPGPQPSRAHLAGPSRAHTPGAHPFRVNPPGPGYHTLGVHPPGAHQPGAHSTFGAHPLWAHPLWPQPHGAPQPLWAQPHGAVQPHWPQPLGAQKRFKTCDRCDQSFHSVFFGLFLLKIKKFASTLATF
jgi:hypothetical protein